MKMQKINGTSQDIINLAFRTKVIINVILGFLMVFIVNALALGSLKATISLLVVTGFLLFLRWFLTYDNTPTVITLFSWVLTILASYIAWTHGGLWDTSIIAYSGVLLVSASFGSRSLIFANLSYMVASIYGIHFATASGLITPSVTMTNITIAKANNIVVLLVIYGVFLDFLIRNLKQAQRQLKIKNNKLQEVAAENERLIRINTTTNLPNEQACKEHFQDLLNSKIATPALIILDFLSYESVGTTLGFDAATSYMKRAANLLSSNLKNDVFHISEKCLSIVVSNIQHDEFDIFINAIERCLSQPIKLDNGEALTSYRGGIAQVPYDGNSYDEIHSKAIIALNADHKTSPLIVFEPEMEQALNETVTLTRKLKEAIEQEQFEVHYQPQIDLETQKVIGAEALIRWKSDGKFIPPDKFIGIAEKTGFIRSIGKWVLNQACHDCVHWNQELNLSVPVSVNLSPIQFLTEDLTKIVARALTNSALSPELLDLEITESLMLDDIGLIEKQIKLIKAMGVSFSIDDFGSGYSNLNYLRRFNASTLKIDRMFVTDIESDYQKIHLINSIIHIGELHDMKLVAEGIEDQKTYELLTSLGCAIGQGYFWSKPLPLGEFIQYLQEHSQLGTPIPLR